MIRVMLPKIFLIDTICTQRPPDNNILINTDKQWYKAINTTDNMNKLTNPVSGMEMDVYFSSAHRSFFVHHDVVTKDSVPLETLLQLYTAKQLTASIWFDFKNLCEENKKESLQTLIILREKYHLKNKMLIESSFPHLLNQFSDSGFYTSYYVPFFIPYALNRDSLNAKAALLRRQLSNTKVHALSGYYFQFPFLHTCFPNYSILVWGSNDRYSLITWIYNKYIRSKKEVLISLAPL